MYIYIWIKLINYDYLIIITIIIRYKSICLHKKQPFFNLVTDDHWRRMAACSMMKDTAIKSSSSIKTEAWELQDAVPQL